MKTSDLKHFAYGRSRRRKDNDHQSIANMRAAGYAVVVIEPQHLAGVCPREMEAELTSAVPLVTFALKHKPEN